MACAGCATSSRLDFQFSMAFQPIFDAVDDRIWGYEALVRGLSGESAFDILSGVRPEQKYRFDQDCRVKAIELASRLFPPGENVKLSINFMPNAVYEPVACLRATLLAATRNKFPMTDIMFEFTEDEEVTDPAHLTNISSSGESTEALSVKPSSRASSVSPGSSGSRCWQKASRPKRSSSVSGRRASACSRGTGLRSRPSKRSPRYASGSWGRAEEAGS
jgi:hypothetical protein